MSGRLAIALLVLSVGIGPGPASAQESQPLPADAIEQTTDKLLAGTVTLRVLPSRVSAAVRQAPSDVSDGVTVCSGVSLGDGVIVTFISAPADARFRVTLSGGEQAEAQLQVTDQYSGLSLLEISRKDVPGLEPAEQLPKIGGAVLTAAAAGIEKPVVSLGILGGIDRSIPGSGLPPLLQCDVRTTETSSGAAIVNRSGQLIGIVVATEAPVQRAGWTYAVPVRHVQRLARARVDDRLVVLRRRRPSVGLTMGPGEKEGTVVVERVVPGGPADKAGIRQGDLILQADGRKIRSAYQAVDLILKKQAGDKFELLVQPDEQSRRVEVTLGGGMTLPALSASRDGTPIRIGPQLTVRALGRSQIEVRHPNGIEEVAVDPTARGGRIARDELSLLKTQLLAFEKVINRLQEELRQRDAHQVETEVRIQALTAEVLRLRKQLQGKNNEQPMPDE